MDHDIISKNEPLVRLVDDDADLRVALLFLLESEGWQVRTYAGAEEFLQGDPEECLGCLILDYTMPGMNGLELQQAAVRRNYRHPIIFLTAHADLDMAISAFRRGADDLLKKPVNNDELLAAVARAVEKDKQKASGAEPLSSFEKSRYQELTERELQIIRLVLSGLMNYQIAERLGLSERTVQVHRANTYRKLGVRTVAELARFMERAQEWT